MRGTLGPLGHLSRALVLVTVVATTARSQPPATATPAAPATPAAAPDPVLAARGKEIYATNCVVCHGADGRGGADAAADLSRSVIASAPDNGASMIAFLKVGRPERRMPSFALSDADVAALSAFLRTLLPRAPGAAGGAGGAGGSTRGAIEAVVVGDAARGEAYFNGAGRCATCHSATGDLKGIGARLPVATIQGRIVLPRGNGGYPRSFLSPPDPTEAQRTVIITDPSGETVSGTLLWITDFNVTLVDAAGVRRTVTRRNGPKVEVTDPLQYHIDHMKTLTDWNMHDLTAYLVTLK